MEKLGQRQSAQISVISVLFLCVLYGMRFAILYGMFSVDRNLVFFLYRADLIHSLWLQVVMSKRLCCFVPLPHLAGYKAVITTACAT